MFRATSRPHPLVAVLLALLIAAAAQAQGYSSAAYGLSLTPPAGWTVEESIADDQSLLLTLVAPSQDVAIVFSVEHLGPDDLADGGIARRNAGEREAADDVGVEFPGARITSEFELDVGGAEALGFEFESTEVYGTVLVVVGGGVLYGVAMFSRPAMIDAADGALSDVLGSVVFTSAGTGTGTGTGAGTGSAVSGSGLGSGNPLVPDQLDPWVGTFVGDQLTLRLQGGGGAYAGQIVFGGQTYPVRAQGGTDQISGTFASGGADFPFTAVATGTQVTFSTGGASYLLRR